MVSVNNMQQIESSDHAGFYDANAFVCTVKFKMLLNQLR